VVQAIMARVFLSHSSKDKPFVRELHRRLKRDGVVCFFDEESIEWGANFVVSLERGIDECEFFVAVLSPEFVQSKWVKLERTSAMADDPAGLERKMRPLLLQACEVPRFLKPIQLIDVSTAALFEENYPRICQSLGGAVRPDPEPPRDRGALPPVTPLPTLYRMPYRSLGGKFVGRVAPLWRVYDQLSQGKTSIVEGVGVVCGAGGLGKTQLAVEYVHRFNCHYPGGVFWVEADQGMAKLVDVLSRSAKIEVDGKRPTADQLEEIWTELNRRAAILVVLDNFPEREPLEPWLPPSGSIHVVVTTRRRDLTRHPQVSLPLLTVEEGLTLLNSGNRRFGQEAAALVEDVGGLPLALELLRSYLDRRTDVSVAGLRETMVEAGEVALLGEFAREYRDELPTHHERDVAATFQVSWQLACEDGKQVLRVMSQLAPAPVPLRLLRAVLGWPESPGARDRLAKATADLWDLSLVDHSETGDPAAHRLILGFVRHLPESNSPRPQTVAAVEKEMLRAFDDQDTASFRELEAVVPHAECLVVREDLAAESAITITWALGRHHRTWGRYVLAKSFLRDSLSRSERAYAPGHSSIAASQSNLAAVLQDLGELQEARDLLRKALASNEARCAPGHPPIARSQSNLALVLQDLGELEEARDLLRKALASDEASYAAGHPSIARRQSNLATVLKNLGELQEAHDLLRKALASDEANYAAGHPSIATRQGNLALVLKDLGELEDARDLLRKVLASDEASYAPGHPSIASDQSNLAQVLQDLGELREARDLLRKALASDEASYAAGHPSIARGQSNLAMVLKDLGELEEARDLLKKAYASALSRSGFNHPMTRTFRGNLEGLGRKKDGGD
jgi:tetratricopeptide (TPR) repeat protein